MKIQRPTGSGRRRHRLRKIVLFVHHSLGLTLGMVIFIISITGCMYAFQVEIQDLTQPFRFVKAQNKEFLPPSSLKEIADKRLPGKVPYSVVYGKNNRAAQIIYINGEENYNYIVYLNPYDGEVQKVKNMNNDFFRMVWVGHYYLWLPPNVGQPIVATATGVFVVMMITGLFLWWPRNQYGARKRFSIKWNARWRRKNYDTHSVMGFYVTWIAIFFALTGLVWGFTWFGDKIYWIASGGKKFHHYEQPINKTSSPPEISAADKIWTKVNIEYPFAETIEVQFPDNSGSSIHANINPDAFTYWKTDYRYFDQHNIAELPVHHPWGRQKDASRADQLMRMNYDIHVGAILGLPGKFLAFFASLVVASLPVTGFVLWRGRRKRIWRNSAPVSFSI